MSKVVNLNLDIHHVTRVEGHGNIHLSVKDGQVKEMQWIVPEAPRFFEAMLQGKPWHEVALIVSRICGICSIGHTLASLKATEAAMGIKISDQTFALRDLLKQGENIQSHVLHVGYLALPDLFKVGSVVPLASSNTAEVLKVVEMHRIANDMCDLIGGRTTHPVTTKVNGFSRIPTPKELTELKKGLERALKLGTEVIEFIATIADRFPKFSRETEYVAVSNRKNYPLYDGGIASTDSDELYSINDYRKLTNEYMTPQSTAKYTKHKRESLMVGALARFNVNYKFLSDAAKGVAKALHLEPVCYNPYMNTVAQVVEIVESIVSSMSIIDQLLDKGLKQEDSAFEIKAGQGVGVVEVPRGILIHDYTYDAKGFCTAANCIIPTNQNHANIQLDMEALAPTLLDKDESEIGLLLEMLVRAYDPCISCSTHTIKVKIDK